MQQYRLLRTIDSNYALVRLGVALLALASLTLPAWSSHEALTDRPITLIYLLYAVSLLGLSILWPFENPLRLVDTALIDAFLINSAITLEGSTILLAATPLLIVATAWATNRRDMGIVTSYHLLALSLAWIISQWHLSPAMQGLAAVYLAATITYALRLNRRIHTEETLTQEVDAQAEAREAEKATPVMPATIQDENPRLQVNLLQGSANNVEDLEQLLLGWGMEVSTFRESAAFIAQSYFDSRHNKGPDVLLLDQRGRSGQATEILSMCRSSQALASLRCILISDTPDDNAKETGRLEAFDSVLLAPLDKTLLFNAIHATKSSSGTNETNGVTSLLDRYIRQKTHLPPLEILIAIENQVQLKLVKTQLERDGHHVYTTSSGEQALDAMTAHSFDVAMLDLQLQDMDAIEVTRIYRLTHSRSISSPVVMIAAELSLETQQRCEHAGADAALTLPLRSHQLNATLARLTGQEGAIASVGLPHSPAPDSSTRNLDVIDTQTLRELEQLGNGLEFLKDLLDSFVSDSNELFEMLQAKISVEDLDAIHDYAHALKGSAGSVGASRLQNCCVQLTTIQPHELKEQHRKLVSDIKQELRNAHTALLNYVDERNEHASRS